MLKHLTFRGGVAWSNIKAFDGIDLLLPAPHFPGGVVPEDVSGRVDCLDPI